MLRKLAIAPIRLYQLLLSPLLGPVCRFQPTCSTYMADAILTHGVWRGGWIGARRLCRCHPFGGQGYDPVPTPHSVKETTR